LFGTRTNSSLPSQFARFGEHHRALGGARLAKHNSVDERRLNAAQLRAAA
jgi:hypothetical protein